MTGKVTVVVSQNSDVDENVLWLASYPLGEVSLKPLDEVLSELKKRLGASEDPQTHAGFSESPEFWGLSATQL